MNGIILNKGVKVSFGYKGNVRTIEVEQAKNCKNGNVVLVGKDIVKGEFRSFDFKNISNLTLVG